MRCFFLFGFRGAYKKIDRFFFSQKSIVAIKRRKRKRRRRRLRRMGARNNNRKNKNNKAITTATTSTISLCLSTRLLTQSMLALDVCWVDRCLTCLRERVLFFSTEVSFIGSFLVPTDMKRWNFKGTVFVPIKMSTSATQYLARKDWTLTGSF